MTFFAWAAISVALLTGPLTQADTATRSVSSVQVAQAEQEVQPAPANRESGSGDRIAAFWIILPD